MKNIAIALFALTILSSCSKPKATEPVDACKANIEAAYAKGISDAFGFLTKVRQGGIAKGGGYDISVKGLSATDISSCVACGTALLREGIKLMRAPSVAATPVGTTSNVAPTSLPPLGQ